MPAAAPEQVSTPCLLRRHSSQRPKGTLRSTRPEGGLRFCFHSIFPGSPSPIYQNLQQPLSPGPGGRLLFTAAGPPRWPWGLASPWAQLGPDRAPGGGWVSSAGQQLRATWLLPELQLKGVLCPGSLLQCGRKVTFLSV